MSCNKFSIDYIKEILLMGLNQITQLGIPAESLGG